ncbi:MAG TPA: DUF1326 domain-containing protein [Nitrososphaeraceae archaeon]|jgi:hypothetical protein|nr:DUF1326 domain-containing protein [Nitrososphaeraceae archaeon]
MKDNGTNWRLEGDYFDGCNCKSICPCVFMLDPTEGDCKAVGAWHIENGHFSDGNNTTNLDNLNAAAVFYAPGNMFTGPKMKMALYLDERASNDQKDALTKIFTGQVGGNFFGALIPHIGEVMGIRSVPIEFIVEGKKRRKIKIPSALELEIEGMTGSDTNKESKVVNPAFAVAPDYDPIIARSTKHTYRDHGLEWDNTGRNSFYSRFTYTP